MTHFVLVVTTQDYHKGCVLLTKACTDHINADANLSTPASSLLTIPHPHRSHSTSLALHTVFAQDTARRWPNMNTHGISRSLWNELHHDDER